jgi:hypothetical protein
MDVLPGVLGCSFDFAQDRLPLRRTVQVRLGFDLGFRISDLGFLTEIDDIELNSSDFAIRSLVPIRSLVLTSSSVNFQSAIHNPHSAIVDPVARPSSSRSLCSAQSRKRVPSFVVSRQQFMKYPG